MSRNYAATSLIYLLPYVKESNRRKLATGATSGSNKPAQPNSGSR